MEKVLLVIPGYDQESLVRKNLLEKIKKQNFFIL